MKSELDITRAHDFAEGLLSGDIDVRLANAPMLQVAKNVLCWVLDHDHNPAFGEWMAEVEATLFARGILLVRPGDPPPKIATDI